MFEPLLEPFRQPRVSWKTVKRDDARDEGRPAGFGHPYAVRAKKPNVRNWKHTLGRIFAYLAERKFGLAAVLLLTAASVGLALLGPLLVKKAIDDHLVKWHFDGFGTLLVLLAAVYACHSLFTFLQNWLMIGISQQTVYHMRRDLFAKLQKLPIPYFDKRQQGELMSRMTNDVDNVSSTLNGSVIQVWSSTLMLIGTFTLMVWLSPILTLLTAVIIPAMFLGMQWITRRTGPLFKQVQRELGVMNGFIEETVSGQRIIKTFSLEERVIAGFAEKNERYKSAGYWAQVYSGFIPKLMNALNNFCFAIIAGIGGILAFRGYVSIGTLLVFVEYSRQFTRPLNDLSNQFNTMLSAIAGAERVFEVMDAEEEAEDEGGARELESVRGEVEFDGVSFHYEGSEHTLEDVSFRVSPGQTVALVGPTGAGKTTLIQLLARFYEPQRGTIRIDGIPLNEIKRDSWRRQLAVVLQDPFLFRGTVRENIRFGRPEATDAEVEEAARQANAHLFIVKLPDGYDTMLDPESGGISQGQKQLLAIARAMVARPAVLILDEATSNIDTVTEIRIQEAMQRLMAGRTSFVIAHRLNTIRGADLILVLKEGRLAEAGTHESLLAARGFYHALYHPNQIERKSTQPIPSTAAPPTDS
jgi:ATP-binding cassette subfamily B protein